MAAVFQALGRDTRQGHRTGPGPCAAGNARLLHKARPVAMTALRRVKVVKERNSHRQYLDETSEIFLKGRQQTLEGGP